MREFFKWRAFSVVALLWKECRSEGRVVEVETVENLIVVVSRGFGGRFREEGGVGAFEDEDGTAFGSDVRVDAGGVECVAGVAEDFYGRAPRSFWVRGFGIPEFAQW